MSAESPDGRISQRCTYNPSVRYTEPAGAYLD